LIGERLKKFANLSRYESCQGSYINAYIAFLISDNLQNTKFCKVHELSYLMMNNILVVQGIYLLFGAIFVNVVLYVVFCI